MASAIDKDDFNFKDLKYLPEISLSHIAPHVQADRMENYMKNNTLAIRAVPISSTVVDANHSIYVMDTCIRAKILSDTFRQDKAKYWEEKYSKARVWTWVASGAAAILTIGTLIGIIDIYRNLLDNGALVVGALAIVAITALFFRSLAVIDKDYASYQMNGWKASPLEKMAEERAKAYREGFPYIYSKDLKLQGSSSYQVILPSEVHFLFERHFDQFCSKLLSQNPLTEQEKKEWLDAFTSYNPVDGKILRYANEGVVPEKYVRVSYDYENLHKQLTDLRGMFDALRNESHEESNKIIQEIKRNRELTLIPFQTMLTYWELQAKTERDTKLASTTDAQEIAQIEQEYSSAFRSYHLYYTTAIIPVNLAFDKQVSDAKTSLKRILDEIKKNEASSHAPYFNYAWNLLDYARQVKQAPTYVYQSQPFIPAQAFNIPPPSAPPVININFVQQAQQQRPQGIDDSNYADYLRFVSWQRDQPQAG